MEENKNLKEKVQNKIIDLISSNSVGRLIISKIDEPNKDLKIEKRADYKSRPVYIKIFSKEHSSQNEDFIKTVFEQIFTDSADFYLFAFFDFIKQDIDDNIFIIPSSLKDKNDFSKFIINKKDLSQYFIEKLHELDE